MYDDIEYELMEHHPIKKFNLDEYKEQLWIQKQKKLLKNNSSKGTKAERQIALEKFLKENTKEEWCDNAVAKSISDYQTIPMDKWYDKSFFDNGTVNARLHHHFFASFYDCVNQYETKNDTLVLLNCKEYKPYSEEGTTKMYMKLANEFGFDLAMLSASICPLHPFDASKTYPFNIYNWPANRVGQYNELVTWWTCNQIAYMLCRHGYKRVILVNSGNWHYETQFDEMILRLGHQCKFINLGKNGTFIKKILDEKFTNPGLSAIRFTLSVYSRALLITLLGYDADEVLKDSKDYLKTKENIFDIASRLSNTEIKSYEDILRYDGVL